MIIEDDMGIPAAKMIKVPTPGEFIENYPKSQTSKKSDGSPIERDTGERITQSGFIYDPVFTPLHSLMNE